MPTARALHRESRSPSRGSTTTSKSAAAASTRSNDSRITELVRGALTRHVEKFLAAERELDDLRDPESVHRARVAVRRLRSLLRTFLPLLDRAWANDLREHLRIVSDGLSAARDADVLIARVKAALLEIDDVGGLRADDLIESLAQERAVAYAAVASMRQSESYAVVVRALRSASVPTIATREGARTLAAAMIRKAHKRMRTRVRRCGSDPSDETLHAVRIAAKHLRYALEALEPIAGRWARRAARRVGKLQDVLGEEHDAAIVVARMHDAESSGSAFAAGELAITEQRAVARARARWRKRFDAVERSLSRDCPS